MPFTAGDKLGPYEILAPIGAGGMGEVFRAHDKRLSRDVAIKVLPEEVSGNPERLARCDREARTLAALCHPNTLAIYDVGTEKGVAYLVTELLEGETLRQRLNRERLPWREAVEIAASIADGLAAAHGKGITHRDVKPENVFLTADGRVKVLDFGLARMAASSTATETTMTLSDQVTAAGMVLGTAGYMAPEQVRGQEVDHRADLFALGAILYEMLAGRRAFHGESAIETLNAILKEEPPDLHAPPGLDRVVRRCLEKKPARRFHSAADLAFALETLSGSTAAAPSQPAAAPSAKRRWRPRWPRSWWPQRSSRPSWWAVARPRSRYRTIIPSPFSGAPCNSRASGRMPRRSSTPPHGTVSLPQLTGQS